jgi:hypothetical protein
MMPQFKKIEEKKPLKTASKKAQKAPARKK